MKTTEEFEKLRTEDLDRVLSILDEMCLEGEAKQIVKQRMQWSEQGLCDKCGSRLIHENVGFIAPDPEMWQIHCTKCDF